MTAIDPDGYYERRLCRYEREVDLADREHEALVAEWEAQGFDESDLDYYASIAPDEDRFA